MNGRKEFLRNASLVLAMLVVAGFSFMGMTVDKSMRAAADNVPADYDMPQVETNSTDSLSISPYTR